MEIADVRCSLDNHLPICFELYAEYAVCRRMLRTHLKDHPVAVDILEIGYHP